LKEFYSVGRLSRLAVLSSPLEGLQPYINLGKIFDEIFCLERLSKQAVLAPPLYGGAGEKDLTVVKSLEPWGVKKLKLRSSFIRVHRIL